MSLLSLKVNGQTHTFDVDPTTPLLYVLSDDLGLRGPKFGCGLGQCGSCTVLVKGQAVRSCITAVESVQGVEIIPPEGLGTIDKPHPLQKAFIEEQAAQCGYCLSGVIMEAAALLAVKPHPSETEIRTAPADNLCRCGTHVRIVRAVQRAASGKA